MRKLVFAALAAVACSSSTPASGPPADAGGNPDTSTGGNTATLKGTTVAFGTSPATPEPGVTVKADPQSATTDAMGLYSLSLTKGTAFNETFSKDTFVTLIEQEAMLTGDQDRGNTSMVDNGTEAFLLGLLSGYDKTLAVFSLQVIGTGSCKADGATVALVPSGSEKLLYFKKGPLGNAPDPTQTSVIDGLIPSAIFYNVTPGQKIVVKITTPTQDAGTCVQVPFPTSDPTTPNLVFTGNVTTVAAQPTATSSPTASFARYYLK